MTTRILAPNEREALTRQGCRFALGCTVKVDAAGEFDTSRIHNVTFAGEVTLGSEVTLENIGLLSMDPGASCGYGAKVNVLDETGSLDVPLYPGLTAVAARAFVSLRDRIPSSLWEPECCRAAASGRYGMTVGAGATVRNCGELRNVAVGAGAVVEGACALREGVIGDGSRIGAGVIASVFMTGPGAVITDGCIVEHSFVGEGCTLSGGFTSRHSLIFDNSMLDGGESEALFAGPHTVSMHKSTLLIGVMTSFFNAGSGTNFSNHRYKTGPKHFGVCCRGVKMGSDSYIMWPARVGAYSVVMGRHYKPFDSLRLPYSYITADTEGSSVIPGAALKSVGFMRDISKWPLRDKRALKANPVSYDPFPASAVSAAMDGLELLKAGRNLRGLHLADHHRRSGIDVYTTLIDHVMSGVVAEVDVPVIGDIRPVMLDFGGTECSLDDVECALAAAGKESPERFMSVFTDTLAAEASRNSLALLLPRWDKASIGLSAGELAALHDETGAKMQAWWEKDAASEAPFLRQAAGFLAI